MVACAVPVIGGVRTPSLARPMLQAANAAFLAGHYIEAAAKLREAIRRHLAAEARSHRLADDGTAETLVERLTRAGSAPCCWLSDTLTRCDDVLTLRTRGKSLRFVLELAFELLDAEGTR